MKSKGFAFNGQNYAVTVAGGFTEVYNDEGLVIFTLPGKNFEDKVLQRIILIHNNAFHRGVTAGKDEVVQGFRKLLQLSPVDS